MDDFQLEALLRKNAGYGPDIEARVKCGVIVALATEVKEARANNTEGAIVLKLADQHNIAITFAQRDVLRERAEQVTREGFGPAHDDAHRPGVLANAAAAYALGAADKIGSNGIAGFFVQPSRVWPFSPAWWKPKDPRTAMVKAAALLIAEIEKMDRRASRIAPTVFVKDASK